MLQVCMEVLEGDAAKTCEMQTLMFSDFLASRTHTHTFNKKNQQAV